MILTIKPKQPTRAIYLSGLNKGLSLKFGVGSQVQEEIPEEDWKMNRQKRCEYNNKDKDNSPNKW